MPLLAVAHSRYWSPNASQPPPPPPGGSGRGGYAAWQAGVICMQLVISVLLTLLIRIGHGV